MPETNLAGTKLSMTDAGLSSHDLNILSFLYPALPTEAVTAAAEYKDRGLVDKVSDSDAGRLELELKAIRLAESGQLKEALHQFDQIVKQFPEHPSPLNNRAQILRLLRQDNEAHLDLTLATGLSATVIEDYPLIMRQVFMQRGLLLMASHDNSQAQSDFQQAASLGAKDAQKMVARCNPYAAMCNAMMAQVMQTYYS